MKYTHEDRTPYSKEEFLQKLKTDKEFNDEFGNKGIDQISDLIKQLKENPDSRRLLVSAWNISDLPNQVLPPCHYGFQVYTRELSLEERYDIKEQYGFDCRKLAKPSIKQLDDANIPTRAISLIWNQRSVDTPLGLPFNIASYGLLLEIIAKEVNMVPDELIGNLGDTHIYLNQIDGVKEQLTRESFELPKLKINTPLFEFGKPDPNKMNLDYYNTSSFELINYKSQPKIEFPLSN
jgi:thymidylate synthase